MEKNMLNVATGKTNCQIGIRLIRPGMYKKTLRSSNNPVPKIFVVYSMTIERQDWFSLVPLKPPKG